MRRGLVRFCVVISTVVGLAACALWVRSYFVSDAVAITSASGKHVVFRSASGQFVLFDTGYEFARPKRIRYRSDGDVEGPAISRLAALHQFGSSRQSFDIGRLTWFPQWPLTAMGLAGLTTAVIRWTRRRLRAGTGFPVEPPAPSSPPRV